MLADAILQAVAPLPASVLPDGAIGAVIAIPALLALPGWAWVTALAHRTAWSPDRLERLGFAVALSVAILALGGVALSQASVSLTSTSWALLVAVVTLPPVIARLLPATHGQQSTPARQTRGPRSSPASIVASIAAGLIALSALTLAVLVSLNSDGKRRETLTELGARWTVNDRGERALVADVHNLEGRAVAYSLHIETPGGRVRVDRRVRSGGWWTPQVPIDAQRARAAPVVVSLFRDGGRTVYRSVRIAPDLALPVPCTQATATAATGNCVRTLEAIAGGALSRPDLEVRVLSRRTLTNGIELGILVHNPTARSLHVTDRAPFALAVNGSAQASLRGRALTGPPVLDAGATGAYRLAFATANGQRPPAGDLTLVLPSALGPS